MRRSSSCWADPVGRSGPRWTAPGWTWRSSPTASWCRSTGRSASPPPREGAEAALQAIEAGFTTLKLKAGAERETEDLVARVRAIRQAVGPDVRLRLDVNGAWDLPTAEDRLDAVARFDIQYVEQPLPADDTDGRSRAPAPGRRADRRRRGGLRGRARPGGSSPRAPPTCSS